MLALENFELVQGGFRLTADCRFQPNQTTAILGPSGGGKSTLLMGLAGFIAHSGEVRWQGQSLKGLSPAARPVSMLFQEHNLFPHLTIAQNVGLGGKGEALPRALSGGQRQRAALARALLRQKPIWLLDEPFAALGPGLRREMLALVEEIRTEQGATLLLVTHAPEDAQAIAATVGFVDAGRVEAPVDTGVFFAQPTEALRAYLVPC